MAKAAELIYAHLDEDVRRLYELKEYFADRIGQVEGIRVNGIPEEGMPEHGTPCGQRIHRRNTQ